MSSEYDLLKFSTANIAQLYRSLSTRSCCMICWKYIQNMSAMWLQYDLLKIYIIFDRSYCNYTTATVVRCWQLRDCPRSFLLSRMEAKSPNWWGNLEEKARYNRMTILAFLYSYNTYCVHISSLQNRSTMPLFEEEELHQSEPTLDPCNCVANGTRNDLRLSQLWVKTSPSRQQIRQLFVCLRNSDVNDAHMSRASSSISISQYADVVLIDTMGWHLFTTTCVVHSVTRSWPRDCVRTWCWNWNPVPISGTHTVTVSWNSISATDQDSFVLLIAIGISR